MAAEADFTMDEKKSWTKKPRSVTALFSLLLLLLVVSPLIPYQPMKAVHAINVERMRSTNPPDLNSFSVTEKNAPTATGGFNEGAHGVSNAADPSRN